LITPEVKERMKNSIACVIAKAEKGAQNYDYITEII
jgi:hypothetical protein